MESDPALNRWRVATFSLAFLLLAVLVAWVTREQAIRYEREQERAQWEADWRLLVELREEQSREIERLDLAADEARRELRHRGRRSPRHADS